MQNRSFSRDQGSSSAPTDDIDEEKLRTLWCGGISEKVDEEILYELFLTAGPLERVTIPKDRETKKQKNFAFIVFQHQESTEYAFNLFNGTELFRQAIRLQNKDTGLGELTGPSFLDIMVSIMAMSSIKVWVVAWALLLATTTPAMIGALMRGEGAGTGTGEVT